MTVQIQKKKPELICYIVCTIFSVIGAGLSLAGLLVPYWYEVNFNHGIVKHWVNVGLWNDYVCEGTLGKDADCELFWTVNYDRHELTYIPSGELIKWFETIGTAIAFLSLCSLIFMWVTRNAKQNVKYLAHFLYFTPTMVAAFLCVVGCLILASKGEKDNVDWAAFLSGGGGAAMFLAGCLSCVVCRYEPSYGTLENPVSPKYIS